MNITSIIKETAQQFNEAHLHYGHGTDNSFDEAVALVFHVLALPFDIDESELRRELSENEITKIESLVGERISTKKPLPYLTHIAYFAGLPFYVDERVIIPRSPFAELIERQFSPWIKADSVNAILDLCAGSGCMAIAAAFSFSDAIVDAVELSREALEVAKINVEKHQVSDRVQLIRSDLFEVLPNKQYDIIMSNPPYVSGEEMAGLPQEYLHEPKQSLEAADEGLEIVLRIIKEAPNYLSDQGILVIEVGNSQEALEKRLPNVPFIWLEFESGGEGVFLLTADDLRKIKFA